MIRTALQLVLLGALFALCRWAVERSGVPVPAGLVALVLLTALLLTRAVPERAVGGGADALLRILPALFVPSGIAVLRELPMLRGHLLSLVVVLVASVMLGLLVAGVVGQAAANRERQ
ncbi:MAG TPA: CidA/LrgA family protein [Myxococcaceae bacterium]|nr:CidA/LrgA family protein [Myxococcaceae bacterium]